MKNYFLLILFLISHSLHADKKTTFTDILKRVETRDPITNAIISMKDIKNRGGLRFKISVIKEEVTVRIWANMKIKDPNEKLYTFQITSESQLEIDRLLLYKELTMLKGKCSLIERKYRIRKYTSHPIAFGMKLKELKKFFGKELIKGPPHTKAGDYTYFTSKHIIEVKGMGLYDIRVKENP
ncbi:MAG: hypothetical protein COA79_19285 [Planctomycetota bacterium]|nr:MAG: hypothetical protein COA79_19285 [Planctomycetota bacterium]